MEIELPNGTVLNDVPDNATQADVLLFLKAKDPAGYRSLLSSRPDLVGRGFNPAVETALQGATFGLSDEMQAGAAAGFDKLKGLITGKPVDFTDRYNLRQQALQGAIEQQGAQYPLASTIGNISGGLLTAAPIARLAGAIPGAGKIAAAPNALKIPAIGATSGAVAGAASSPQGERGTGAAIGGTLGGVLGGATAGVVGAANRLGGPANRIMRKVGEAFERDETTPQRAAARLRTLGPESTLADAGGENVLGLARATQSIPGKAKNRIQNALFRRDRKQAERLLEPIERTLGNGRRFAATFDDLSSMRQEAAAPLYEKAHAATVRLSKTLSDLMERPAIKDGIQRARAIAADEGTSLPDELDGASLKAWDYVKRGIDDVLYGPKGDSVRHVDPLTRKIVTEQGRAIAKARGELVDELDRQVPIYGEARAAYAGPTQSQDAMEAGAAFLASDVDKTAASLAKLSGSDKAFFRLGVAKAVRTLIERKGFTNDVTRLFDKPGMQRKLQAVFPDTRSYRRFIAQVKREARMSQTKNAVVGNSVTARLQAEQADLSQDSIAGIGIDAATGNTRTATMNLARKVASITSKLRLGPRESAELERVLFTAKPAEQARILAQLENPAALRARFGPAAAVGGGNLLGIGVNQ